MLIRVQATLIVYVRREAPDTYRFESAALRYFYGQKLLGVRYAYERRMIGREYAQAKAALVIDLTREVSRQKP